ncbi:YxeA family protein [Lactococcus protaetiae]|uniref:YxeA family protein n=1 Tax=Lactococcus protaetiae TaxID=2592653 RepID=A0A514ZAW6_9LACT|nr:YxeA family protein [Lactococcus protaetiae]QDK71715.1 YxeA family protein [Lactococcus protaetiae]
MKKILFGLIALIVIIAGSGYAWYKISYGGTSYYIQVTQDGKKVKEQDDTGKTYYHYEYKEKAYDKNGKMKQLDFNAEHNLRHEAYLKLTYNKAKGVTNWEEVQKAKIPSPALKEIQK